MFTTYIDDAGTDPRQKVAIATGLIIPAKRLTAFQSEWNTFSEKWGVKDFHASACAVANRKSDFAGWKAEKISKGFQRIRQITKKYGVKCYSLAVNKTDYDAVIPTVFRPVFGDYHYTWAVKSLLTFLDIWACRLGPEYPLEYIFDWMDPKTQASEKLEIQNALSLSEAARPGRFEGHFSFRHRKDYPGLQCVDLLGWTCYRFALNVFEGTPLTPLQQECWTDFDAYRRDDEWLKSVGQTRQMLEDAVNQQRQLGMENKAILPHDITFP